MARTTPATPAPSGKPAIRSVSVAPRPNAHTTLARSAEANDHYGQLPLAFESAGKESAGDTQFLARGNGYALFLTTSEAILALGKTSQRAAALY